MQEGVLDIVFRVADDKELLLIDLKDLRSMLNYVSEHAKEFETTYGKVSSQSVGAILRALISVEDQGGDVFFGEPALDLSDWFACAPNGQGYVNVLNAAKLIQRPQIYAMFLLWMLSELFETLPEEGDLDKPKFVFFFDEAHLLFNDMPNELLDKIVQVVKLIRSKGVGVYFITQSPERHPRRGARPAVEPHPARASRLHARRAEGGARRRELVPREPGLQGRGRDPGAGHRRGAGVVPERGRPARDRRARQDPRRRSARWARVEEAR